jgi:hypothetical protein
MPKVRYDDGLVINFDSTPSDQEIEEAYNQVRGENTPIEKLLPKKVLSIKGAVASFIQGIRQGMPDLSKSIPENIKLKEYPGLETEETFKAIDKYQPGGFTEKLLRAGGNVVPMLTFSKPFMKIPGLIPGVKALPAIIKSGLGFGAYEATKAKLGGEDVLPAAIGGAVSGMAMHGAGKLLSTAIPRNIPGAERIGSIIGGAGVGAISSPDEPLVGATVGGAFGAKYPSQRISRFNVPIEKRVDLASKLIKNVIGLKQSDYRFGNPALEVIKENIKGNNVDEFKVNLSNKIDEIDNNIGNILTTSSEQGKLLNYESALRPLIELRTSLKKAPDANAAQITAINGILNNLKGYTATSTGQKALTKYPLSTATPADAYKVKQTVNQLIKNAYESPSGGSDLAKALKETNYKLVKLISIRAGNIKGLDKKYLQDRLKTESLLITAKSALDKNILAVKAKESILPEFLKGARLGAGMGGAAGVASGGLFGGVIGTYTGAQLEKILLTPNNRINLANWLIQTPKPQQNLVYEKFPQLKRTIDKIKSKLPKSTGSLRGLTIEDKSGSNFGINPRLPITAKGETVKPTGEGKVKQPYEMTQKEFENIPIIKYIEKALKDKTNPLKVPERNKLAEQLVNQGLMSIEDFNAMTRQYGWGGSVSGVKDLTTGKPIPSIPIKPDLSETTKKNIEEFSKGKGELSSEGQGTLLNYIGQWQTFTNVPLFAHREAIVKALVEGKKVPQNILDEYKTWKFPDKNGDIGTLKEAVESYGGQLFQPTGDKNK